MMVSQEELSAAIENIVCRAMEKKPDTENIYITHAEAMRRLGVSRATLWHWDKSGYLRKIKRGSKVTYRLSDVEKILRGEL